MTDTEQKPRTKPKKGSVEVSPEQEALAKQTADGLGEEQKPRPKPKKRSVEVSPEQEALAKEIANGLGEKEKTPRYQIIKLLSLCDMETCRAFYEEALQIEANG